MSTLAPPASPMTDAEGCLSSSRLVTTFMLAASSAPVSSAVGFAVTDGQRGATLVLAAFPAAMFPAVWCATYGITFASF